MASHKRMRVVGAVVLAASTVVAGAAWGASVAADGPRYWSDYFGGSVEKAIDAQPDRIPVGFEGATVGFVDKRSLFGKDGVDATVAVPTRGGQARGLPVLDEGNRFVGWLVNGVGFVPSARRDQPIVLGETTTVTTMPPGMTGPLPEPEPDEALLLGD